MPDSPSMQDLLDRHAIQEVLHRYAWGLDLKDPGLVATCFTEDVEAEYAGERLAPGRQAILDYTGQRTDDRIRVTTHAISNVVIRFDGDLAYVTSLGVVGLREQDGQDGEHVRTRAIQYSDRFRRTPDGWLIDRRRHAPLWETVSGSTGMPMQTMQGL